MRMEQDFADVIEYTPEEQEKIIKDGKLPYNYRHFLPSGVDAEFIFPDGRIVYFPSGCTVYIGKGIGSRVSCFQKGRRYSPYVEFVEHLKHRGVRLLFDIFYSSLSESEALDNESKAILATGRIGNGGYLFNQTDGGEYGTTGSTASVETRSKRSISVKNNVLSGSKANVRLIVVDGITDSLKATAVRIGMDPNGFRKWEKEGFTHQEIADQFRKFGIGKGNSLFPHKTLPKQIGRVRTPEEREKQSVAHKGKLASDDTKQRMRKSQKSAVFSGKRTNTRFVIVDGITDSINATSKRIGIGTVTFLRLINKGFLAQDIADRFRSVEKRTKSQSLFPRPNEIMISADGITDNILNTCKRMGISRDTFDRLTKMGFSPQNISDQNRLRKEGGKGPLFHSPSGKPNSTGFVGVSKHYNLYSATITNNGSKVNLGSFTTAIEAAKAYNVAAIRVFGPHAYQNIIP